MPPSDRPDRLRRDPTHVDHVLQQLARLVRRRVEQRAYTQVKLIITDGAVTDVVEERRAHAEESAWEVW